MTKKRSYFGQSYALCPHCLICGGDLLQCVMTRDILPETHIDGCHVIVDTWVCNSCQAEGEIKRVFEPEPFNHMCKTFAVWKGGTRAT